ncbi:MAG TPA: GNAT family N-acetyltransferase [Gemmatimonadales bacterium]|nr:GNAT family N-acetyltransferase [Gemmatimonadales bacterium]
MTALPLPSPRLTARAAQTIDVPAMVAIMDPYIATGDLLPRTAEDLRRDLERYVVVTDQDRVVGMGALKPYSPDLAEVIAVAVDPSHQGAGVGRLVVGQLLERARRLGLHEVFALTRRPFFFHRLGFRPADKSLFPQKVWWDCASCPRQHACDEIAVHVPDLASWRLPG